MSVSEQEFASQRPLGWNVREHPQRRHAPHGADPRAFGARSIALASSAPTGLETFGERALARHKIKVIARGYTGTRAYTSHVVAYVSHPTTPTRNIAFRNVPVVAGWNSRINVPSLITATHHVDYSV
jgi:hypothetical protein